MGYKQSDRDKSLRDWFTRDYDRQMLREISLEHGRIRSLTPFNLKIDYPISAIAGKNGAGKSTLIAIACCAYHGDKSFYKIAKRKYSYYTFKDFFIQRQEENNKKEDVLIKYYFAVNNLKIDDTNPDGKGIGYQVRKKNANGKWNDYNTRLHKQTIFIGIERIVPHIERSQSKSYCSTFKNLKKKGWEDKVKDIVGNILGKNYDEFLLLRHSKYTLPIVKVGDIYYSGFNMGAGENSLFEIFSSIYESGGNSLIVIDEIELGLHAEAQRKFIRQLKETCIKNQIQVIFTTHSKEIFDSLPDDARFFVEEINGKTRVTQGISSDFAMAKLGAMQEKELQIFVEDDVAKAIITCALNANTRTRVEIKIIGSSAAIARQLAAAYARSEKRKIIALLDGDQLNNHSKNIAHAKSMAETKNNDFEDWVNDRMSYLPSQSWPEHWLIQSAKEIPEEVSLAFDSDADEILLFLDYAEQAGKHNELYELSSRVGFSREQTLNTLASIIAKYKKNDFQEIVEKINFHLSN